MMTSVLTEGAPLAPSGLSGSAARLAWKKVESSSTLSGWYSMRFSIIVMRISSRRSVEKIFSTERLEEIRMTIIENLMLYHPESVEELSTFFHGIRSILEITTADRPGLLVDIVKTLKDVSVNV